MRWGWLACLALAQAAGIQACAVLPEIPAGECGNGVVDHEKGEDCDTFATGENALCRSKGSVNECRLDCSRLGNGKRRPCPPDWGCSLDDICRPQSERFEQRVDVALGDGGRLLSADFDGDHRADVVSMEPMDTLGATHLRFHYFDDRGELEQSIAFPKLMFSPLLAELSGDQRSDVAFSDGRVGLLLGQGRSWVPETFGSYRLRESQVRMISVSDLLINGSSSVVALTTMAGQPPGFYVPNGPDTLFLIGELPAPPEALMGAPVSGNILEDASSSPCSETVLALPGAEQFQLVDFCTRGEQGELAWRSPVETRIVTLSPAAAIDAPAQIVDVDGDGHLDVLIGAGGRPYVARGDGQGLRDAVPYRLELANSKEADPEHGIDPDIAVPLAVGDFSGDGLPDFVFPDHLLVSLRDPSSALPRYLPTQTNPGSSWTEAKIADLNGNGKPDVVCASRERPNIDFFNGTGSQYQTVFSLPTNGPARELTIADFDGDLLSDLAFMEDSTTSQRSDALMISFGNLAGSPTTPVPAARISGVEQLSVFIERGIGVLMVASNESDGELRTGVLTMLEGNGDRTMTAPYPLRLFSSEGTLRQSTALSLTAGAFGAPGQRDILTFASSDLRSSSWEFWLLPQFYSRSSEPVLLRNDGLDERLLPAHETTLSGPYGVTVNLASASADFDGAGRDEAVFAMPSKSGGCGLVLATIQGADWLDLVTETIDEPCETPQLAAVDVDADGAIDIALLTGTRAGDDGALRVFWNDGQGSFSAKRSQRVSAEEDSPVQFTVLPETPARRFSFAYVSKSSARLLTQGETPGEFEAPITLAALERGTGIVAADLNGDGALDLAFSDAGSFGILKAELKAP